MAKATIENLDTEQLDLMWSMLQLGGIKASNTDVDKLIKHIDIVRQAMIQKTAGQRSNDPKMYVDFNDLGTYINLIICEVLALRITGRIERMYDKEETAGESIKPDHD